MLFSPHQLTLLVDWRPWAGFAADDAMAGDGLKRALVFGKRRKLCRVSAN